MPKLSCSKLVFTSFFFSFLHVQLEVLHVVGTCHTNHSYRTCARALVQMIPRKHKPKWLILVTVIANRKLQSLVSLLNLHDLASIRYGALEAFVSGRSTQAISKVFKSVAFSGLSDYLMWFSKSKFMRVSSRLVDRIQNWSFYTEFVIVNITLTLFTYCRKRPQLDTSLWFLNKGNIN